MKKDRVEFRKKYKKPHLVYARILVALLYNKFPCIKETSPGVVQVRAHKLAIELGLNPNRIPGYFEQLEKDYYVQVLSKTHGVTTLRIADPIRTTCNIFEAYDVKNSSEC